MMRILILCTGNSCRSQMAHGFMQSFDDRLEVCSAGTVPAECVHPLAVKVMNEVGIDISTHTPQSVQTYLDASWDYVITVLVVVPTRVVQLLGVRWSTACTLVLTTRRKWKGVPSLFFPVLEE